jgi:hypothetical protein
MTSTLNLRNDTLIKKKMLEIKEDYMNYIFRCCRVLGLAIEFGR